MSIPDAPAPDHKAQPLDHSALREVVQLAELDVKVGAYPQTPPGHGPREAG